MKNLRSGCALFTLVFAVHFSSAEELVEKSPSSVGMDSAKLDEMTSRLSNAPDLNIHSVLILKQGDLVYEKYFSGSDEVLGKQIGKVEFGAETLHDLRSVSKSVTSLLVGIAVDRGLISDIDAKVVDLLPEYREAASDAAKRISLRDVLTMSAGLEWNERLPYTDPRNDETGMWNSGDPIAYLLGRQGVAPPGEAFTYNGGLTILLGAVLQATTGQRVQDWAREVLFEPLGIRRYSWHQHENGLAWTASGLRLTPRDMAKIGTLVLNGGRWEGRQVVSTDWLDRSFQPAFQMYPNVAYGYQWLLRRLSWQDQEHSVVVGDGNGGQRIFVVRDLNMVVVITAGNYNNLQMAGIPEQLLMRFILPAARTGPVAPGDVNSSE